MFTDGKKIRIREFIDKSEDLKELKKVTWKQVVNGEIFTHAVISKQLSYFLFITFLAFIYIANHYKVEKSLTELARINRELKELNSEAITTSSELMNISKQSEVLRRVHKEGLELEMLTEPPRILDVD
jgi:hypothetical protein